MGKRVILRTIPLNNGKLTYEDRDGELRWYRNDKPIDYYKNYKFYDKDLGAYRTLSSFSSATYTDTPYLDRLSNDAGTWYRELPGHEFKFGNKHITLHTKGKMNLATIPYNMLDSIAINTGRSNTNIKDNLGLVGKESTFGGYSIPIMNRTAKLHPEYFRKEELDENGKYNPVGYRINASTLVNNYAYSLNKYNDYYTEIFRKIPVNYSDLTANPEAENKRAVEREKLAKDAYENNRFKDSTPHYHEDILADAFARYATNPTKYNPGQGNYVQMVNNIGNEVWNEPQIQTWWNTEGKNYYNKGLLERVDNKRIGGNNAAKRKRVMFALNNKRRKHKSGGLFILNKIPDLRKFLS